jgi:hypothetical protein
MSRPEALVGATTASAEAGSSAASARLMPAGLAVREDVTAELRAGIRRHQTGEGAGGGTALVLSRQGGG